MRVAAVDQRRGQRRDPHGKRVEAGAGRDLRARDEQRDEPADHRRHILGLREADQQRDENRRGGDRRGRGRLREEAHEPQMNSTFETRKYLSPAGTVTSISSSTWRPISARPSGDLSEIRPPLASASVLPTAWHRSDERREGK